MNLVILKFNKGLPRRKYTDQVRRCTPKREVIIFAPSKTEVYGAEF